jgi:hypothetical protein
MCAAACGVVVAGGGWTDAEYGEEVDSCVAAGTANRQVCGCIYSYVRDKVSYKAYLDLSDAAIRAAGEAVDRCT